MNATASRTLRNIIIRFPWLRPRCGACCAAYPMWESKPQRITNEKVGGSPISTRPKEKQRPTRGLEQGDESPDKTRSAEEGRRLPRGICARRVSTPSGLHFMRRQHRLAFRRDYVPVRYEAVLKRL